MKFVEIKKVKNSEGHTVYQFGTQQVTKLALIEDVLCCQVMGGYIPIEDFIRLELLSILEKDQSRSTKSVIKKNNEKIGSLLLSLNINID